MAIRLTESKLRQIIREEAKKISETWQDDETYRGGNISGDTAMFLEAHPDWRDDLEMDYDVDDLTDGQYRRLVMNMVTDFGHSHEQPWVNDVNRVRSIAKELIDNT